MNRFLTTALLGIMSASTLSAVSKVSQGDSALSSAREDGIIIFCYAADWDRYSKRRCDELMQDKSLAGAAGDAVYLPYPSYETPTDAQNKKLTAMRGKLNIPRPLSYPALLLMDKKGHHLCTIEGRDISASSNAELAKLVAKRLKAAQQQAELVAKAMATTGVERAKLMGKACKVEGLNFPADAIKLIKEADPKDSSGYAAALETNDYKEAAKVSKMEMEDAIAYVTAIVDDERYTPLARQGAIAGLLGMWRTKGSMSQIKLMRKLCDKSSELNPDYYHARSAQYIKTNWLKEFSVASGWFGTMIPEDATPVEMTGKIPINKAGTYTVTLNYKSGSDGLTIRSVTLYDGTKQVAQDAHDGFAGQNPVKNIYTLKVNKSVSKPRLVFVFNQGKSRNTNGQIDIKYQ